MTRSPRSISSSSARIPTTSRSAWAAPSRGTRGGPPRRAVRSHARASCRATARPSERQAGSRRGRAGARRGVAREPRLARRRHRATPESIRSAVDLIRRARPRTIAIPYWDDRHPDHVAASHVLRARRSRAACAATTTDSEPWRPDWVCYYFINDGAHAVVRRRRLGALPDEARGARRATAASSRPPDGARSATRLTAPTFRQLIESRDAQFGALAGVAFAEGIVVREPVQRSGLLEARPHEDRHGLLRLGRRQRRRRDRAGACARRARAPRASHQQRAAVPVARRACRACRSSASTCRRIRCSASRSICWRSRTRSRASPSSSSSTSSTRTTPCRTRRPPISPIRSRRRSRPTAAPRTVTTLHGTDITLVGSDPSYARVVAFSIEQSDGVTAVSESLQGRHDRDARRAARDPRHSRISSTAPSIGAGRSGAARRGCVRRTSTTRWSIHVSNFRPVKRVDVALEVFRAIRARVRGAVRADRRRPGARRRRAPARRRTAWPTT